MGVDWAEVADEDAMKCCFGGGVGKMDDNDEMLEVSFWIVFEDDMLMSLAILGN